MRALLLVAVAAVTACVHNTKDSRREATKVFVSGKAYLCGEPGMFRPAVGRTLRLVTGHEVLAEDVVGHDGSYVLHPHEPREVTEPVYIEAGSKRVTLANNFASWLQDHLSYRGDIEFPCGNEEYARAAAPRADVTPQEPVAEPPGDARTPSPRLLPKH
jgi:hypothetical protein